MGDLRLRKALPWQLKIDGSGLTGRSALTCLVLFLQLKTQHSLLVQGINTLVHEPP